MRLVLKFTLALFAGILTVVSAYGYLRVQREIQLFESDMKRDHRIISRAIVPGVEDVWRDDGEEGALKFIHTVNEREPQVTIRWVWLDDDSDPEYRPLLPPSEIPALPDSEPVQIRTRSPDGAHYLVTYRKPHVPGTRPGAIEMAENLSEERAYIRATVIRMTTSVALIVSVCGLIALALGYSFVAKPVQRLVDMARRVGEGDFSIQLDLQQHDEIGTLGKEMNLMAVRLAEARRRVAEEQQARLAALEQLRHADRLASIGSLTAGVAHELGTPLNVVLGRANLLTARELETKDVQENARIISEQSRRMIDSIRQLLGFARRKGSDAQHCRAREATEEVAKLLASLAAHSGVVLEIEPTEADPVVPLSIQQLQQVLMNLIVNAIHASAASQRIRIGWGTTPDGARAFIRVEDEGTGITPENLKRIFEPFFTTKKTGEGTGLGLSVVNGIVREHGGSVEVKSAPDEGSNFTVYLPLERVA